MPYEPGSLVSFRGREWVVLPRLHDDGLVLKPLGGIDLEVVEISSDLEKVSPATFSLPSPKDVGNAQYCALLRDAVRLGLRATTGPFRSFGRIAVDPRPYQLVPLLMAMRQEVVRLLIADDVGIGKTVEALLIARELLDRGEIRRLTVLCPPQLAQQWQKEMAEKFHLEAKLVLPSTVHRLERGLGPGTSLFEVFPCTIVSLDFIKSDRHKNEFLRACPEFVIVDEAHSCAFPHGGRGRQQRYELVRELASDAGRHMLFVTATPHSGKEDVFRSLLTFLKPEFANLPDDLTGREHEAERRHLARYFVQRRRGDVRAMKMDTPFPTRVPVEATWKGNEKWQKLFEECFSLASETVSSREGSTLWQQRIGWWSALALLRAVSSSPAAAAQTLEARALGVDQAEDVRLLDELGSQTVYDMDASEEMLITDTLPGADVTGDITGSAGPTRARYKKLAQMALALKGDMDPKLKPLVPRLRKLLEDGYSPIVFCRFIPTAEYLTEELRKVMGKCDIEAVTGLLPPDEREARVLALGQREKRILVCTDCLSEGVNLQDNFNAVVHYDLSWNPARHEQREGRVDRFGQSMPEVRVLTLCGQDNPMDGMVLDVLLRKHEAIRKSLGVSVPIPEKNDKILETLLKGMLLRRKRRRQEIKVAMLPGVTEFMDPEKTRIEQEWDNAARKEDRRSRALFAQMSIKADDVAKSLARVSSAAGDSQTVEDFVRTALEVIGVRVVVENRDGQVIYRYICADTSRSPGLGLPEKDMTFVFSLPAKRGQTYLSRTHPFVEQLASWLVETTLDPMSGGKGTLSRCGVMRTEQVSKRTTLLLCRFRFQIIARGDITNTNLAEECAILAFAGSPQNASWLSEADALSLLRAVPAQNISSEQAADWIAGVEKQMDALWPHIEQYQQERAQCLHTEHCSVRAVAQHRGRDKVQVQGKPDILGIFMYLPVVK